jgi:hypothetical protein
MKSKASHLLCQHLENISRVAFEDIPELIDVFLIKLINNMR